MSSMQGSTEADSVKDAATGGGVEIVSPTDFLAGKLRARTAVDREAFLASFGGWKGLIDTEAFKKATRLSRSIAKPAPRS